MAKSPEVVKLVEEYWDTANPKNKELMEEYLENSISLSKETLKQYYSGLKVFFCYLCRFCGNKHISEVRPIEFQRYINWLYKTCGLFEANIKLKKSVVSNLNEYLIIFYGDEYPSFRNFVTKAIKIPETGKKFEKQPITDEEYNRLCNYLEEKEEWQKLSWLKFTYISGCRKNESGGLLKSVTNSSPIEKMVKVKDENGVEHTVYIKKYKTNPIKCKGKSTSIRKLSFDEDTMFYLRKWLEVRGEDECPYMFIVGRGKNAHKIATTTFNDWCSEFGTFLNKRMFPHLLRSSRSTNLALSGVSLSAIQKLLGHASSTTTQLYIVKDEDDDEDEVFA